MKTEIQLPSTCEAFQDPVIIQNVNGDCINPATEEKQDETIAAINELVGGLVIPVYDEITLAYVSTGNGEGEIESATYKLDSVTVSTITMTYDASDNLVNIVQS